AMQYPKEEDKDRCMRIDVIEELIRKVQQEEAMSKLQSKQARYNDLDDTNHNFVMQKIMEEVQDFPYEVQNFEYNVQNFGSQVQKTCEEVQIFEPKMQKFNEEVQNFDGEMQKIDEKKCRKMKKKTRKIRNLSSSHYPPP
ncbi:hypothetical protein PIB30_098976, partial [Stylosanthes scabra]|nr:hypothetical protein [Stylosanthes scabra]